MYFIGIMIMPFDSNIKRQNGYYNVSPFSDFGTLQAIEDLYKNVGKYMNILVTRLEFQVVY